MGNSSEKSTKGSNDNKQPEKQQSQKLKETQSTPQSFKCFFDKYCQNSQLDISQIPNIDSSLSQALKTFANSLFNTNNLTLQQYLELSEILTQAPSYQSKLLPKMRPIEIQCRLMGYSENDTIPNEECSKLLFVLFQMILCGDASKFLMNRIYGINNCIFRGQFGIVLTSRVCLQQNQHINAHSE
ncbi:hypothetical protein FGO68_gene17406 [Halteria grandinella]|uniref:Uncharacterized protein n=1 Tax=Halteria grandinella TaxID=5974 RepID=A0A8J8NG32_HALGN|nr:hypothetical protein FGO68_gene17406 [Halteria grandinella]